MNMERDSSRRASPETIIESTINRYFLWFIGDRKAKFNSNGQRFEDLIDPMLKRFVALQRLKKEDEDDYRGKIAKMSPEGQFHSIAGDMLAHTHRNMP